MSAIKLNSSGGGSITISPASTASTLTLTAPAQTGTIVSSDASGNVGIGTSSPAYKLDVIGLARGGIVHRVGTYSAGSTTPSVDGVTFMSITNSSPTTITNFINGVDGQVIYLLFNDSNTTINRANCYLAGGSNFVSTAADSLVLIKSGAFWYEISRSANS